MYSKGGSVVSCPTVTMSEQQRQRRAPAPLYKQKSWSPDTISEQQQRQGRASAPLYKQKSWSPDAQREEAWLKKKNEWRNHRLGRGRSVTDEDLDELRACFELGFRFDSPEVDPKLCRTFPALEFYYAVNRQYSSHRLSRSSSSSTVCSDCDSSNTSSLMESPSSSSSIINRDDEPETIKMRLRQWAQMVACSVRQSSPN